MKILPTFRGIRRSALLLLVLTLPASAADPTPQEILAEMKRVADWQLENPSKHPLHDWTQAPFFLGLANLHQVSGEEKYRDALEGFGRELEFGPGPRVTHADDHAVLQAWLEMDRQQADPAKTGPAKAHFEKITAELAGKPAASVTGGTFTWCWCDALFMSPPVWSRLSKVTGDPKYLAWADREWWTTVDVLYDPQHALFYRDNRFFTRRTESGKKIFWGRGNGWVVGGLVHVLDDLPADHPSRGKYLGLYFDMMAALLKLQHADGLWRTSLLESEGPQGESSGSAFFAYAMAWGIDRGLLPADPYRPAVMKAWAALAKNVQPSGMLGHVQRIGDAPDHFDAQSTEVYGTGAFLLAGSEIVRLLDPSKRKNDVASFDIDADALAEMRRRGYVREEPRAFCRFVPERADDFAWENDLVAFRTYGPALRSGPEDSGIDCWFKRVRYPVIDKWYMEDRTKLPYGNVAKLYHDDQGEGYDVFKVGDSRGCGGISVIRDGRLHNSDTFVAHRVIENSPERVIFELDHASELDGKVLCETKRITLPRGQQLFQADSIFTLDGKPAANLDVAIGLKPQTEGTQPDFSKETGIMRTWEQFDGNGFGMAVVIDPARVTGMEMLGEGAAAQAVCLARTDDKGAIRWYAGFGWEGGGTIDSAEKWAAYLEEFASRSEGKPFSDPSQDPGFKVHAHPVP